MEVCEWKKEVELKSFKSEVTTLERKIKLALAPPQKENTKQHQKTITPMNDDKNFTKEHTIIAREKSLTQGAIEVSKPKNDGDAEKS